MISSIEEGLIRYKKALEDHHRRKEEPIGKELYPFSSPPPSRQALEWMAYVLDLSDEEQEQINREISALVQ